MKKIICILLIVLMVSLCGCSMIFPGKIETLDNWSFQFNEETDDYSLFFGLQNEKGRYISANVDVDIRIVNDEKEEVFSGTKSVTKDDFDYFESKAKGEQFLAEVRIPASEIKSGKSGDGTVYFTVYMGDTILFDEVNCSALYCLPVEDIELYFETLPVEIKVKDYDGSTESIIEITEVSYTYDKDDYMPELDITLLGEKIYGNDSDYDTIGYKLYDSNGYLVDSGSIFLDSLNKGDKFKDDSINIYDITPGETYTLKLTESSW